MTKLQYQTPQLEGQASDIAGNPQWFHSRNLRTLAWAALKAARGQTIRQHQLQTMSQSIDQQVAQ